MPAMSMERKKRQNVLPSIKFHPPNIERESARV